MFLKEYGSEHILELYGVVQYALLYVCAVRCV